MDRSMMFTEKECRVGKKTALQEQYFCRAVYIMEILRWVSFCEKMQGIQQIITEAIKVFEGDYTIIQKCGKQVKQFRSILI